VENELNKLSFTDLIELLTEAIVISDKSGLIKGVNSAATQLFGYSKEDMLGMGIDELAPANIRQKHHKMRTDYYARPKLRSMKGAPWLYAVNSDGVEFPASISLGYLRSDDNLFIVSAIRDMTAFEKREEKLKHTVDLLARSNQDLNDFAYIASHDLKEPLRGIHNYSQFLLEDYSDKLDESGQDMLKILAKLAQRLEDLISDLLEYSRIGQIELDVKDVDANKVVNDIRESLEICMKELDIVFTVPKTLPIVCCDQVMVSGIFRNLVTNAMKYNDKDKKIIEIGTIDNEDKSAPCNIKNTVKDHITFYVKDNGIGIREKHHDSIFRIFKRLHGRNKFGGGTGVGLTNVKKIIGRHGGNIWVESSLGSGTIFYFTLPSAKHQIIEKE